MQGLITELPQPYNQIVKEVWEEIATALHFTSAQHITAIPHFTWHVAQHYQPLLMERIHTFRPALEPIPIRTTGLGIFTGAHPVVFIGMHVSQTLLDFHHNLMQLILPLSTGSSQLYEPDWWTPHITLALGDTTSETTGKLVALLSERSFQWDFLLDNLILIEDDSATGVYSKNLIVRF